MSECQTVWSPGLDPDQDRLNVGPDLSPNCLPRLSTNNNALIVKIDKEWVKTECESYKDWTQVILVKSKIYMQLQITKPRGSLTLQET